MVSRRLTVLSRDYTGRYITMCINPFPVLKNVFYAVQKSERSEQLPAGARISKGPKGPEILVFLKLFSYRKMSQSEHAIIF